MTPIEVMMATLTALGVRSLDRVQRLQLAEHLVHHDIEPLSVEILAQAALGAVGGDRDRAAGVVSSKLSAPIAEVRRTIDDILEQDNARNAMAARDRDAKTAPLPGEPFRLSRLDLEEQRAREAEAMGLSPARAALVNLGAQCWVGHHYDGHSLEHLAMVHGRSLPEINGALAAYADHRGVKPPVKRRGSIKRAKAGGGAS